MSDGRLYNLGHLELVIRRRFQNAVQLPSLDGHVKGGDPIPKAGAASSKVGSIRHSSLNTPSGMA